MPARPLQGHNQMILGSDVRWHKMESLAIYSPCSRIHEDLVAIYRNKVQLRPTVHQQHHSDSLSFASRNKLD
jgi:hypothetical protein